MFIIYQYGSCHLVLLVSFGAGVIVELSHDIEVTDINWLHQLPVNLRCQS